MSIPSMMRGSSARPSASWRAVTPSLGSVTKASGCQYCCSPLFRAGVETLKGLDLVAQLGGALEFHVLGRLDHFLLEIAQDLLVVAFEEAQQS
jgi:hypothetical protein